MARRFSQSLTFPERDSFSVSRKLMLLFWVPRGAICRPSPFLEVVDASFLLLGVARSHITSLTPVGRSDSSFSHQTQSLAPLCEPLSLPSALGGPWITSTSPARKTVSKQKLKNERKVGGTGRETSALKVTSSVGSKEWIPRAFLKIKCQRQWSKSRERSVWKYWGRKLWKMAFFGISISALTTGIYPEEKKAKAEEVSRLRIDSTEF